MDTIIRGGTLVTAEGTLAADVGIADGQIAAVQPGLDSPGAKVMSADGLLVLPGGIDAHTHVDLPVGDRHTADDFLSASAAAACGGTTTLIDMAIPDGDELPQQTIATWDARTRRAAIDFSYHVVLTRLSSESLQSISDLAAGGLTSLKIYMPFPGLMLGEPEILKAMVHARSLGMVVALHAESETITAHLGAELRGRGEVDVAHYPESRPPVAERVAIEQAIALGETAGCAVYVVHVTTAEGLEAITRARRRGSIVYGETCPQFLLLDESLLHQEPGEAAKFMTGPPLRKAAHREALWEGLLRGDIQVVATDHCAWRVDQKRSAQSFDSIPVGLPGLETRLPILFSEAVDKRGASLQDFVRWTSTNPAKIFGLYPKKGSLTVGAEADVVLWDPKRRVRVKAGNLHQGSDYCPFEGLEILGSPVMTMLRGQVIAENGKFLGASGMGRRVDRTRHPARRLL